MLSSLLSQLAAGMVAGPAIVERGASSAKARLLQQLPREGQSPLEMPFEMIALIEELEAQGVTPATPEFLTLGLNGRWACRALLAPPLEDKPPAPPGCELQLGRVERRFDLTSGSGSLSSYAEFELDAIAGRLVVELDVIPSSRADIVAAVTSSRSLEMPRMPPTPIPAAMQLLHSQLSADFLGDEGVRLGLQTTYLDADMHITRCLTRELSGACCVHVRVSD